MKHKRIIGSLVVLFLLCAVLLSRWVLTPAVNHFAEPYRAKFEQVQLNWFPLMLRLNGFELGQGASALKLNQLEAQVNWGLLLGKPITLQVRGDELQVGYHGEQKAFAGLTLDEWQQLAASDQPAEENIEKKEPEDPNQPPANVILQQLTFEKIQLNSEQSNWPTMAINQLDFGSLALRQPEDQSHLSLNIDIAQGQIGIQGQLAPLALKKPQQLHLDLQQLKLNSEWFVLLPKPFSTELTAQLQVALNNKTEDLASVTGELGLKQLKWRDTANQVQVSSVQLDQIDLNYNLSGELAPPAKIPLQGSLNLSVEEMNLATEAKQQVQFQQLELYGIHYDQIANIKQLSLDKLQVADADNKLRLARLTLDDIGADPAVPNVSIKQLQVNRIEASAQVHKAQIAVLTLNNIAANLSQQTVQFNQLKLEELSANSEGKQADLDRLTLEKVAAKLEGPQAKVEQLQITDLKLNDGSNQLQNELLTIKAILFEQILDIDQISLKNILAQSGEQNYQLDELMVQQVNFDPNSKPMSARIGEVVLNEAKAQVQVLKQDKEPASEESDQSEPNASADKSKIDQNDQVAEGNEKQQEPPLYLTLDLLQVKQHQVLFQDHNLAKSTQTEFKLELFELKSLRWPSAELAQWSLDAWLDGQSHWLFDGEVSTQPIVLTLKGTQKGLSLPAISPYSEHHAEVFFHQGVMDNDIELDWQGQHLKGEMGFLIHGLDIKLDGEFAGQNTPLQMALSVIRDSRDRIELGISVDKSGEELT
jgi:hypothetical protein